MFTRKKPSLHSAIFILRSELKCLSATAGLFSCERVFSRVMFSLAAVSGRQIRNGGSGHGKRANGMLRWKTREFTDSVKLVKIGFWLVNMIEKYFERGCNG